MLDRYDFLSGEIDKMIDVIVSKECNDVRQDLRQELYLKSFELLQSEKLKTVKDIKKYIFICLNNKAIEYLKKERALASRLIKFDDALLLKKYTQTNYTFELDLSILSLTEKQLFFEYFIKGYTQKEIAIKRKTSQQQINYKLNKIKTKIKNSN